MGERQEMVEAVSSVRKRVRDFMQKRKDLLSREARIEYCFSQGLRGLR